MARPRVLQVIQRFFPEIGGAETHVAEVAGRIARQGEFDVSVLATDRSGRLPTSQTVDGLPVLRRRSWPRESDFYFSPGIVPVIARGRWDLVHFQGVHTLVPPVGMLAALGAHLPYVLTFHSGGHSSAGRTLGRSAQWQVLAPLLRRADRLVAVSRFERTLFSAAARIDPGRFVVIPNGGVLPPTPADLLPVPGRIITSARLEKYKGHHLVIEALPLVREQVPEAHLVILGSGAYEPVLRALAAELGVTDALTIRSLPPSDRSGMARELASASVMAALSSYEAHPVGIMEAVTLGLPVVGFDVAGIGDLVEDGLVTGVAPDATTAEVASALVSQLRAVTARGPAKHRPVDLDLPTWDTSADALALVYREVLAARRPGARTTGNGTTPARP